MGNELLNNKIISNIKFGILLFYFLTIIIIHSFRYIFPFYIIQFLSHFDFLLSAFKEKALCFVKILT